MRIIKEFILYNKELLPPTSLMIGILFYLRIISSIAENADWEIYYIFRNFFIIYLIVTVVCRIISFIIYKKGELKNENTN